MGCKMKKHISPSFYWGSWYGAASFWTGLILLLPFGLADSSVFLTAVMWFTVGLLWLRTPRQIRALSFVFFRIAVCFFLLAITLAAFLLFPLSGLFPFPLTFLLLLLLQDAFVSLIFCKRPLSLQKSIFIQAVFLLFYLLVFFLVPWSGEKSRWLPAAAVLRCIFCSFPVKKESAANSRLPGTASYRLFRQTKSYFSITCTLLIFVLSQHAWRRGFSFFACWCVFFYPASFLARGIFHLLLGRVSFAPGFITGMALQAVSCILVCFSSVQRNTLLLSLSSFLAAAGQGIGAGALEREGHSFCSLSVYLDCYRKELPAKGNRSFSSFLCLSLFSFFPLLDLFFILAAIWPATKVLANAAIMLFFLFLCGAVWYAGCQPLDRQNSSKIELCLQAPNNALHKRLEQQLILPFRRPAGFLAFRRLAALFFPVKIKGGNHIPQGEPVVFVCNHLEIYGPLITCLHFPVPFYAWILNNMLEKDLVAENLWGGVDKVLHWLPLAFRQKVPKLIAPLILWVMNAVDHIPVYRGARREAAQTIRLSSQALERGDSLMLFPENTGADGESGAYKEEGVSALYTGFASIASYHYSKTGKCVSFLPVYVNKKKKTITIGKRISYHPAKKNAAEKKQLVRLLHDAMESLSMET